MCGNSHYGVPDDVFQASGRHLALSMTSCKQSPARPASLGRWPGGRLFTTLRASVLCSALQTFRALRSMFATLHAGIGVKQTHSYARSLQKERRPLRAAALFQTCLVSVSVRAFHGLTSDSARRCLLCLQVEDKSQQIMNGVCPIALGML